MKICILMGSADISGGSYVIFEHALYLQSAGADVTIVLAEPMSGVTPGWHPALNRLTFKTFAEVAGRQFDLAMATWWRTIYELHRLDARQYCYFVQSIESWFYPDQDAAVRNLANSTYLLGLPTITEAKWIKAHLKERFDINAHLVKNGCHKSVYRPDGPVEAPRTPGRLRVLVEGPLGVDFKNIARTIALLRKTLADEIWLLTISPISGYPGVERVFSRVPAYHCAQIYRSCDVLVKLSYVEGMFGPPLEMFHCGGTAVVYNVTGHDEYIVNGENAIVVPSGDERSAAAAVNELKRRPDYLARLKEGALSTAHAWPDWTDVSPQFHRALTAILEREPRVPRERLDALTREVFSQYVRAENAAASANRFSLPKRFAGLVDWAARSVTRRSATAAHLLSVARARLIEERRQPAPRSKI
ncbi:MAG: glycosyltransferase family 4 protein [Alphaproteobacteria bacterium]|nr:MAG: glycosyltransferase family 4 protein [Alphaproteobacteria bacterium]